MGVDVDETGGHQAPRSVDLPLSLDPLGDLDDASADRLDFLGIDVDTVDDDQVLEATGDGELAAFAERYWETLVELDVNPLIIRPQGQGVVAADALIRLAEPIETETPTA